MAAQASPIVTVADVVLRVSDVCSLEDLRGDSRLPPWISADVSGTPSRRSGHPTGRAKILCVLGRYQYGQPSLGEGTEHAAFLPALARLGHTVVHFESRTRGAYRDFRELNRRLLQVVLSEKPDVLLAVPFARELWLETIEIIGDLGVGTICWTTDDSWKYPQQSRFLGHAFHCMTTTYPHVVPKYRRDGITNVLLTQWAARADKLQEPLPAPQCEYAVTFVGAAHGSRPRRVARLRELGLQVECFGNGWPSGPVASDDIPRIMRQSVISLNFSNSYGDNQLKARTFEVPGAGGFLLTEYAPNIERYYKPGLEIEVFGSLEQLVKTAKAYLANPDRRDAVAWAGFERTRREHTYDRRLSEVIDFALAHRPSSPSRTAAAAVRHFEILSAQHRVTPLLRLVRRTLVAPCKAIWGPQRGPRAARRLLHELTWRFSRDGGYGANGWVGRLFPDE